MIALLGLVLCIAACAVVLARALPGGGPARTVAIATLAAGLGAGVASFGLFGAGLAFDALNPSALGADLGFALAVAIAASAARMRMPAHPSLTQHEAVPAWFAAAAALAGAAALWQMFALASVSPHGSWDAWAIWNVAARFLVRARTEWTLVFERPGGSDYPLLLPLTTARFWIALGSETARVPALIGIGFAAATGGLLVAVVALLRGWTAACVAGAVLAGTQPFVVHAIWQVADVPLGFYFLAALSLVALAEATSEHRRSLQWAAGLAAGCAAWTKNEGLLFLIVVAAASLVLGVRRRADGASATGGGGCAAPGLWFALGAAVPLAAVLASRVAFAPPNYLFDGRVPAQLIAQATDPERYRMVIMAFGGAVLSLGRGWLGLLVLYAAVCGPHRGTPGDRGVAIGGATLALMAAGYFVTYLLSPLDLAWHLDTSCQRLWIQLWPGLLLVAMLALRPFPHMQR